MARVLVACEFSGITRDAFIKAGHDAWSCDIYKSELPGPHLEAGVQTILDKNWDAMIAFPPCTHLAASGRAWFASKVKRQEQALDFIRLLLNAEIKHIALENPIGVISTRIRKPDQIIQPFWFGHPETKATCLWLKNLPKLNPTFMVDGREERIMKLRQSKTRHLDRTRTLPGIAAAMADQWGPVIG